MLNHRSLKKALKFILLLTVLSTITGCSSLLQLRRSASENVLLSIKSNNLPISYSVNSALEERIIQGDIIIPFNKAFKDNVDDYMSSKFNNINTSDQGYSIAFDIKNLGLDYKYAADFGSAIMGGMTNQTEPIIGRGDIDINVTVHLTIKNGNNIVAEKNIISNSHYFKNVTKAISYAHKKITYEEGLNEALNKTVILIDKYLVSLNM
jgi:hypothetical protein